MLIGLGLGPGTPDLLTLRAVRLINEADAVFVPGRIAYNLVLPYRKPVLLGFPMTDDEDRITDCLRRNAKTIASAAKQGCAVFGLLGDPNFFSTFSRLCAILDSEHPGIHYRTEPGVSAITAFASAAGISIKGGFTVSDESNPDVRILLKVRHPRERAEELRKEGFCEFVLVEKMYFTDMKIYRSDNLPETSDYLSVLYASR